MTTSTEALVARANIPWRRILLRPETPATTFLLIMIALFAAIIQGFFTFNNFVSILSVAAVPGIIALAMNQVVLAGEIDISVGSILGVCVYVVGLTAEVTGGVLLPLIAGVLAGGVMAALNATLVTWGRIPSIIVTLGSLYALRGLLLEWGGGVVIALPAESRVLGTGEIAGIPLPAILLLLTWLLFELLSRHTRWGRDILAVGGNPTAAKFSGLKTRWIKWRAFVVLGFFTGLAATISLSQVGSTQATVGTGYELQVLAAVVIGGTSIMGGRGSTAAPVIGALLIGVVLNGMTLMGISDRYSQLVFGLIILLAVSVDVLVRRLAKDPS
ncbi:ABC transporter permease [Paenarthrobacter nicotinovorans]|uniref:ABC transporter permease n=1 Tax=Paenarthrobacter nicotinovorans TaxID=29320 RepID=UPI00382ECE44